MNDIPTWHERAMAHPDHQSGMISEDMIRARMAEEIADLRAEVKRLKARPAEAEIGRLDVMWQELVRERNEARAGIERLRAEKEALYASIVAIERAAAGAIYSQESIHAMALYALKSLEVKP